MYLLEEKKNVISLSQDTDKMYRSIVLIITINMLLIIMIENTFQIISRYKSIYMYNKLCLLAMKEWTVYRS